MRELPARDVQGERHEGVLPRRSAPAEHEPRQTLEIEPNRRGKHANDEEHGGEREAPGHTVAQSDTFALVPADPPPPRHIIIIILIFLTFVLWVHSGQILPDRVSVPTQREVSKEQREHRRKQEHVEAISRLHHRVKLCEGSDPGVVAA